MAYEPIPPEKKTIMLECPMKFASKTVPEIDTSCITIECAWWLPIQKACCVQVLARGFETKGKYTHNRRY